MRFYKSKDKETVKLAEKRIRHLFSEADKVFDKDKKLANRYVEMARNISTRNKVRIPRELKRSFCRKCGAYWKPGANVRIRTREGHIVYYCLECKYIRRFRYKG